MTNTRLSTVTHPTPPAADPPAVGATVPSDRHPSEDDAIGIYRAMQMSRRIDERVVELYRLGVITGGCYSGIGNEGTSVPSAWALGESDVLVPTHRDLGAHVVRGHGPLDIMRQYMKRGTSQTGGKDSSLHLGAEGTNIIGMISHLAHMAPVAVGVALAERIQGRNTCALTTVGDGATSLGDFHEALNFAAVQKLPVVFVIVNNQYAYSTPISLQYACARLSDRAVGYGMVGETVDGTDAIAVLDAARRAYERGRNGDGPTLIESVTMRVRGHSEHDDFKYVPKALLDAWANWDPVDRFRAYLTAQHGVQAASLDRIDAEVSLDVEVAIDEATEEPMPDVATAATDVFRSWSTDWTVPSGEDWEIDR